MQETEVYHMQFFMDLMIGIEIVLVFQLFLLYMQRIYHAPV